MNFIVLRVKLSEDELRDAVVLVFANKQDLPNAMTAAEITERLGLNQLRGRKVSIESLDGYVLLILYFCFTFYSSGTSKARVLHKALVYMKVSIGYQLSFPNKRVIQHIRTTEE